MTSNRFLFNFAASYSGGGFKRLYAYAKWFNHNGGAGFIIHPQCSSLINEFPNNRFTVVGQSRFQRLLNDCDYLDEIRKTIGVPDVYYSYGIPVYTKFGRINWFHLSNVLPLGPWSVPLSLFDKVKLSYLGKRIKSNLENVDIISAESDFSLSLIHSKYAKKFFLSVNGSDDEILFQKSQHTQKQDNIAVVVGTYRYKAIEDSYRVFERLRENNPKLKLVVIGDEKKVPKHLHINQNITMTGRLQRDDVISYLRNSQYYISTTRIENSYNAASEGIFFANESFISDIGPHRELLVGMPFERISIPNMDRQVLHVKRQDISTLHLKNWDTVITEMIKRVSET
ncbi:glycosyltransferase, GG-Bacteroidales peptide system [Legionella lansingensis]|uniref:Glycosyl transferases group 1 n=1 Tax=Legionella lansingensis TaxID=45067 RepID=A0A0W0VVM6_9GAMM|nr:glycosyltransferase [Legionella lansingensis]KTD24336.1 Glycosyl transferases group 1 [Legionella lansingensis]SNV51752.1 glycosyltransferase, GG-Bacteroidales peptide system [Legionella lansingensis]